MFRRALFIGRFQPFHLGHLHALMYILSKSREVVIGIGSSQEAYTPKNPFSAGERYEMIRLVLKRRNLLDRCMIVYIPDSGGRHLNWGQIVKQHVPHGIDIAYSNDPITVKLLEEAGFKVRNIPFKNRRVLNATYIRTLMAKGLKWEKYVPEEVASYIKAIHGVERVRILYQIYSSPRTYV